MAILSSLFSSAKSFIRSKKYFSVRTGASITVMSETVLTAFLLTVFYTVVIGDCDSTIVCSHLGPGMGCHCERANLALAVRYSGRE